MTTNIFWYDHSKIVNNTNIQRCFEKISTNGGVTRAQYENMFAKYLGSQVLWWWWWYYDLLDNVFDDVVDDIVDDDGDDDSDYVFDDVVDDGGGDDHEHFAKYLGHSSY